MSLNWICVYFDLVVLFDRLEVVGFEMRVEIFMLLILVMFDAHMVK